MGTSAYMPYTNPGTPVVPPPPRLHWGWVLLLSVLTRSFFNDIWLLVQANWISKTSGRSDVRTWAIVNLCKLPVGVLLGMTAGVGLASGGQDPNQSRNVLLLLEGCFGIAAAVVYLVTVYKMRRALEEPPIGIPLGGVMTFFFGAVYFQYFLRDWTPMDYSINTPYPQYTYPNVPPPA